LHLGPELSLITGWSAARCTMPDTARSRPVGAREPRTPAGAAGGSCSSFIDSPSSLATAYRAGTLNAPMPRSTCDTWLAETPIRRASSRTDIPAAVRADRRRSPTVFHGVSRSGIGLLGDRSPAHAAGQAAHGV